MAELKTKKNSITVKKAIENISDEQQRTDSKKLLKIFFEATKEKPIVWSNGVIGFGTYKYKSDRSAQHGEWFVTGFSPRKQNITIYIIPGTDNHKHLLKQLGKYKISGRSCLSIKTLSDINIKILKKLIIASVKDVKKLYKSIK